MGITLRTALLSWLVTIVTLLIFVTVIIPQQKRTFLENLTSKAHGVAVSVQNVSGGATINGDYSSVVEHCLGILDGDKSIDYLVITKNDGESQLFQQKDPRWQTEKLDAGWRPVSRVSTGGIALVPLFQRQVFYYSQPFDYQGIEWGWIHVGLSLGSYHRSVAAVYQRTGLLAVICILLSLLASAVYAKRLVRPILHLRKVVEQVAGGDLSARALVESGDELGSLAKSFNTMTDNLRQRDRILESVGVAAQQFLTAPDWRQVINGVLTKFGRTAAVSRAYVFQNHPGPDGGLLTSMRHEYAGPNETPLLETPRLQNLPWTGTPTQAWAERLERGEVVSGFVSQFPSEVQALLAPQRIQSLILVPIMVDQSWWGYLGLDECTHPRVWTDAERDSLRAVADMLSGAITRQRTQDALLEAKATLEQRVLERTRELQEQMAAKEKAHAELAEAQRSLIETSRLAGMAEVATGVLHNVGNVLNSVSVSAGLVGDRLRQSKVPNLRRATNLLRENEADLGAYLTADPKGKLLPGYLSLVADQLAEEQAQLVAETTSLSQHIEHIKQIVAMQQNYAKVAGALETLSATELVEDALRMNSAGFDRHRIQVVRELEEKTPLVCVDRHKVLQILINLLRNAKYAMDQQTVQDRRLIVRVETAAPDRVRIQVRDTGIGIGAENLIKIFSHGFTTKRDGYGFGLHSGANAAKEMGGSLTAQSEGVGQGATFTLELPTVSPARPAASPPARAGL